MSEFLRDSLYNNNIKDPTDLLVQHDKDINDVKTDLAESTNKLYNIITPEMYGAKGNANFKKSADGKWYQDAGYTILATDDTQAIKNAIAATPEGQTLFFPRNYLVSSQIEINKPMGIQSFWGRLKSGAQGNPTYGGGLMLDGLVAQSSLESVLLINCSGVEVNGLRIKGQGNDKGSVGVLCKSSNGTNIRKLYVDGFGSGLKLGNGSAHVTTYDSILTNNNDAVAFGAGNLFDFCFINCLLDGNVRSGFFLEANVSTENVSIIRTQMGWPTNYGILQDPATTTGDGFSLLHLIDSPIEQVGIQPISIVNGGNIRIEGGYWTWNSAPQAVSALSIKNLNSGGLWFAPKLEASYPNANSPSVISITGYTNYNIYLFGSLNGFAQKWANWGSDSTPLPIKRVFLEGKPFANQEVRADKVTVTPINNNQTILSTTPLVNGAFKVNVYLRVINACTVTVTLSYNNGAGVKTKTLVNAQALVVDDYFYSWFGHMETYNAITLTVNASVDASVQVSACIIPH